MMKNHNILTVLAIVTITVLIGGCAALRVDVDVYKGPLSDHEDIQIERLAVMAIGVRPLLVDLRDKLENVEREQRRRDNEKLKKEEDRCPDFKCPDFECPNFDRKQEHYREKAVPVTDNTDNFINCETLIDPQAVRVNAVLSLFQDTLPQPMAAYIAEIKFQMALSQEKVAALTKSHNDWKTELEDLKPEFNTKPTEKQIKAIKQYYGFVEDKNLSSYHVSAGLILSQMQEIDKTIPKDYFLFLEELGKKDSQLAGVLAKVFFQGETAQEFAVATQKRAADYLEFVHSLERLLVFNLKLLDELDNSESMLDNIRRYDLIKAVSQNIVKIATTGGDGIITPNDEVDCKLKKLPILDNASINEVFLETCPAKAARTLLEKHEKAKSAGNPFGLAIYIKPNFTSLESNLSKKGSWDILESNLFRLVTLSAGAGLEDGRLPDGLATYIQRYLKASQGYDPDKRKSKKAFANLHKALVDFAQKVLAIANNEVLLAIDDNVKFSDVKNNLQMLQAVGNSILTQANELRFRESHQDKMKDRLNGELNALREVYSPSPKRILTMVVSQLTEQHSQTMDLENEIENLKNTKKEKETEKSVLKDQINLLAAKKDIMSSIENFHEQIKLQKISADQIYSQGDPLIKAALEPFQHLQTSGEVNYSKIKEMQEPVNVLKQLISDLKPRITEFNKGVAALLKAASILNLKGPFPASETSEIAKAYAAIKQSSQAVVSNTKELDALNDFQKQSEKAVNCLIDCSDKEQFPAGSDKCQNIADENKLLQLFVEFYNNLPFPDSHGFAKLRSKLDGTYQQVDSQWTATLKSRNEQLEKEREDSLNKDKLLQAEIDKLEGQLQEQLQEKKDNLDKLPDSANLSVAIKKISEHRRAPWLLAIKDACPMDIIAELKIVLLKEKDQDSKTALQVLAKTSFDIPSMGGVTQPPQDDPKLVIDQLTSALSFRYMQEVQQGGTKSQKAENLALAIDAVKEHRSGMIYIRPASSYLRSSYPATSLQQADSLGWKNMLVRSFGRSIPLIGELVLNTDEKKRIKVLNEIDKQSWQNINTVRLTGAGNTNYAIAKDDIGNWTVKAYSADSGPIIDSALGLAKFSMGVQLGGIGSKVKDEKAATSVDENLPQPTLLERLHKRYETEYSTKSSEQIEGLLASIEDETLKNKISNAWEEDAVIKDYKSDLEPALNAAWSSLKDTATEIKNNKDKDTDGSRILRGLKALKRFYPAVDKSIMNPEVSIPQEGTKERASAIAKRIIRAELEDRIAARKATVDAYFTATTFTGETLASGTK